MKYLTVFGSSVYILYIYKIANIFSEVAFQMSIDLNSLIFAGDAVLDTVIVWWLYLSFPDASPAVLTFFKGLLVNNYVLCSVAVHELQVQGQWFASLAERGREKRKRSL